jgi:hypothetical protein
VEKPTVIEEEPKHDANKPKAAEPRQILTRAVHSQQKAETELLQINAEIERLNKSKAELEANDSAQKKAERRPSHLHRNGFDGGQKNRDTVLLGHWSIVL